MTIRGRLAVWYAAILLLGLILISAAGYYEMVIAHPEVKVALASRGHTPLKELGEMVLFGGVPALVLALVGGWFLMRRALRPLTALTQTVERVHADTLHERLPRSGNRDELDRLTSVFNAMMARLETSFSHSREFTQHASHELKTPLTIMRAEIESALREARWDEFHRELLVNQLDEIQRLTKIVDGLTFLTKADAGQVALKRENLSFDELVKDLFADAQILAQPQNITVTLSTCDAATVSGDRHRLRQLLLNLVDNAIRHNQANGRVALALLRQGDSAQLRIENTGAGITPEKLPRVFERFFRGDVLPSVAAEGSGLGLSIAEWIAQVHGGSIKIASNPDSLTTVTVSLPLKIGD